MLKILLIEDSDIDAFMLHRAIRDNIDGAECLRSATLKDGEGLLQERGADISVILLDLGLPDTADPADTYERIKKWSDKIPIVVITNIKDHHLAKSLVKDGVEDYMSKDEVVKNPALVRDTIDFAVERHVLHKKLLSDKESAQEESRQKDTVIKCFMGGYSASE